MNFQPFYVSGFILVFREENCYDVTIRRAGAAGVQMRYTGAKRALCSLPPPRKAGDKEHCMRLRHIPGCEDFVAGSTSVVHSPEQYQGRWSQFFGNTHPIELEIGMGKGQFIRELSRRRPEVNFLGLERYETVLMKAIQRKEREEAELPEYLRRRNLYFLCEDARRLPELFSEGEISKIYLNFSDPWPKASHAPRRLTSPAFMKLYDIVLTAAGQVEFKTDNQALFAWSLEAIPEAGWELRYVTHDLHAEPEAADNVMTEYEEKFSAKGQKICKLIAVRKSRKAYNKEDHDGKAAF